MSPDEECDVRLALPEALRPPRSGEPWPDQRLMPAPLLGHS